MPERTLYEILQIPSEATEAEIRDAYRTLAWQPADSAGEQARRALNDAYSILVNPARRAVYDQELAIRTVENRPAPLPASRASEPDYPQGPWPMRLWGRIAGWLWHIGRIRVNLVRMTWLISFCLVVLAGLVISEYDLAARYRTPVPSVLADVAHGQTTPPYITVSGTADYTVGYSIEGTFTKPWHVLHAGPNVVFFQGGDGQTSGAFTGVLQPFPGELQALVQKDIKEPFWQGVTVLTTHYMDLGYRPYHPGWYLALLAIITAVLLLMLLTAFRRYTVFVPHVWGAEAATEGEPAWPILAETTGTFYPAEGRGWGIFGWRAAAAISWHAEPGTSRPHRRRYAAGITGASSWPDHLPPLRKRGRCTAGGQTDQFMISSRPWRKHTVSQFSGQASSHVSQQAGTG